MLIFLQIHREQFRSKKVPDVRLPVLRAHCEVRALDMHWCRGCRPIRTRAAMETHKLSCTEKTELGNKQYQSVVVDSLCLHGQASRFLGPAGEHTAC